jgi:DNA repair exonuclease SbcCD ATPase subunit
MRLFFFTLIIIVFTSLTAQEKKSISIYEDRFEELKEKERLCKMQLERIENLQKRIEKLQKDSTANNKNKLKLNIKELEYNVANLTNLETKKDNDILLQNDSITKLNALNTEIKQQLKNLKASIQGKDSEIAKYKTQSETDKLNYENLNKRLSEQNIQFEETKKNIREKEKENNNLKANQTAIEKEIAILNDSIVQKNGLIISLNKIKLEQEQNINNIAQQLITKNVEIERLNKTSKYNEGILNGLKDSIFNKQQNIVALKNLIAQNEKQINELKGQLQSKNEQISKFNSIIGQKDDEADIIKKQLADCIALMVNTCINSQSYNIQNIKEVKQLCQTAGVYLKTGKIDELKSDLDNYEQISSVINFCKTEVLNKHYSIENIRNGFDRLSGINTQNAVHVRTIKHYQFLLNNYCTVNNNAFVVFSLGLERSKVDYDLAKKHLIKGKTEIPDEYNYLQSIFEAMTTNGRWYKLGEFSTKITKVICPE